MYICRKLHFTREKRPKKSATIVYKCDSCNKKFYEKCYEGCKEYKCESCDKFYVTRVTFMIFKTLNTILDTGIYVSRQTFCHKSEQPSPNCL